MEEKECVSSETRVWECLCEWSGLFQLSSRDSLALLSNMVDLWTRETAFGKRHCSKRARFDLGWSLGNATAIIIRRGNEVILANQYI